MARRVQSLKIAPSLQAVLRYVGVARGGLSPRQVGEEVLLRAIEAHPLGAQLLALVNSNLKKRRREKR